MMRQPRLKQWVNVPQLVSPVTVTEKIDGHTIILHIDRLKRMCGSQATLVRAGDVMQMGNSKPEFYRVWVQNRQRIVTPESDVAGVAAWARDNAVGLVTLLGEGVHAGEWWGYKICRGYGLPRGDRRFSLFNTARWGSKLLADVPGLSITPVLWEGVLGPSNMSDLLDVMDKLRTGGSHAAPGYLHPEGVVVYHQGADTMMKYVFPDERKRRR